MVPFDKKSPFITSGIRFGTPAITTRGVKEDTIPQIVELIDETITNYDNQDKINSIKLKVNELMNNYEMFAY